MNILLIIFGVRAEKLIVRYFIRRRVSKERNDKFENKFSNSLLLLYFSL